MQEVLKVGKDFDRTSRAVLKTMNDLAKGLGSIQIFIVKCLFVRWMRLVWIWRETSEK